VILKDYPNADIATTEKHFSEILNNFDKNDFTMRDKAAKDFRKRFDFDITVSNYIKFFKSL
jgi:hypothetical protein